MEKKQGGKVIPLRKPDGSIDRKTLVMWRFASSIDDSIKNAISNGLHPKEVVGVLADRLAETISASKNSVTSSKMIDAVLEILTRRLPEE
jgi:hypothetical protein